MKLNLLYMFQIKSEVQTSVSWSVSSSNMSETPSQNKTIFQINRLQISMGPKICARTKKDPEMYNPQLKRTRLLFETWNPDRYRIKKCQTRTAFIYYLKAGTRPMQNQEIFNITQVIWHHLYMLSPVWSRPICSDPLGWTDPGPDLYLIDFIKCRAEPVWV